MALQNGTTSVVGAYTCISGVQSVGGDFIRPNPHAYNVHRVTCTPWQEDSWYGYGHEFRKYTTPPLPGLGGVHSELIWTRLGAPASAIPWADLEDRAYGRLFENLRGSSELLVDLAESKQTLRMLANVAKLKSSMLSFASDVLRGRTKWSKRRISEYASNKWLEYRYGWVPLASSVHSAVDASMRRVQNEKWRVCGSARHVSETVRQGKDDSIPDHQIRWGEAQTLSARVRFQCEFHPPPLTQQQLSHWTSLNPLSIAWELATLSFVADWLTNVGVSLRNWENYWLYTQYFAGGIKTTTVKCDTTGSYSSGKERFPRFDENGHVLPIYYGSKSSGRAKSEYRSLNRQILESLPTPGPVRFRIELNGKRVADAAALTKKSWSRFL